MNRLEMICDIKATKAFAPYLASSQRNLCPAETVILPSNAFHLLLSLSLARSLAHWAELNMTWVASLLYSDVHHGNWDERSRKCFISASLVLICRHKDNIKARSRLGFLGFADCVSMNLTEESDSKEAGSKPRNPGLDARVSVLHVFFFFLLCFLFCLCPWRFCGDGA